MENSHNRAVDLRGLQCPMPLVKGSEAVNAMLKGEVLKVIADKAGSMAIDGILDNVDEVEQISLETMSGNGIDLYIHYLRRS